VTTSSHSFARNRALANTPVTAAPEPIADLRPEALYRVYASRIERRIWKILGEDGEREDLAHEVLITVFRRIGTLRNPACLDRWIDQVTINTLKYTLRQRRLRRHASWEALPEQQAGWFWPDPEGRDLAARAIRLMERLPENDRILLQKYWFTSLTAREIAANNGCSTVTMARRLYRARNRFEKLARGDPALARCVDEASLHSPRWKRYAEARTRRVGTKSEAAPPPAP
jgi:RNA polymerase sigma factor (sigma-70 family)